MNTEHTIIGKRVYLQDDSIRVKWEEKEVAIEFTITAYDGSQYYYWRIDLSKKHDLIEDALTDRQKLREDFDMKKFAYILSNYEYVSKYYGKGTEPILFVKTIMEFANDKQSCLKEIKQINWTESLDVSIQNNKERIKELKPFSDSRKEWKKYLKDSQAKKKEIEKIYNEIISNNN